MFKPINKIIRTLIISDFFLNSAWGLLSPIFAIFVVQNITNDNAVEAAKIVGFATLYYWVVKSILQVPIGRYLIRIMGKKMISGL